MNICRKLQAVILCLALTLCLIPETALAGAIDLPVIPITSKKTYTADSESGLRSALTRANEGDTIKLTGDIHLTSNLHISKAITFTTDGVTDRTIYVDFTDCSSTENGEKWGIWLSTAPVVFGGSASSRLIIDGQGHERTRGLLYVSTGCGATISFVTARNCINTTSTNSGNNGCGGIYISNGTGSIADTTIDNCIVENCTSQTGNGGGMTVNTRNVHITNCTFTGNSAPSGLGGGLYQPAQSDASSYGGCVIEHCVFNGNTARDKSSGHDCYLGIADTVLSKSFFGIAEGTAIADATESMYYAGNAVAADCTFYCDICTTGNTSYLKYLPVYGGGAFVSYVDGEGDIQEAVYTAGQEEYEAYLEQIEESLRISLTRSITDDLYMATGTCSIPEAECDVNLYVYYCEYDGSLRVLMEKTPCGSTYEHEDQGIIPSLTLINVSDTSTTTTTDDTRYGLSLLYQLSDGTFIVVDGGYDDDTSARRLYDKMVQLHGSSTGIVISAWILTHTHNDHAGAIVRFAKDYGGSVVLEQLLYNLPADYEYMGDKVHGDPDSYITYKNKVKSTAVAWADSVTTLHPGCSMNISGAQIDVLYTSELIKPVKIQNINETSVVFTISVGTVRTCILGDASERTEQVLLGLYDGALESDIVTVAHHGYYNRSVSSAIYEAIDPDKALWPVSSKVYGWQSTKSNTANVWLTNHLSADNIYTSFSYGSSENWGVTLDMSEAGANLGAQIVLGTTVGVNFVVTVNDPGGTIAHMTLEVMQEGDESAVELTDPVKLADGSYVFSYTGIGMHRLTDAFICSLTCLDSSDAPVCTEEIEAEDGITVAGLLKNLSDTTYAGNTGARRLIHSLLRLGAEAQLYTGWHTSDLPEYMEGLIYDEEPEYAYAYYAPGLSDSGSVYIAGTGLQVDGLTGLYVELHTSSLSGLSLKIHNYDDGGDITIDLSASSDQVVRMKKGVYRVYLGGVQAYEYQREITVTLLQGSTVIQTYGYSLNAYCYHMKDDAQAGALARAIYNYGVAAEYYVLHQRG